MRTFEAESVKWCSQGHEALLALLAGLCAARQKHQGGGGQSCLGKRVEPSPTSRHGHNLTLLCSYDIQTANVDAKAPNGVIAFSLPA